MFTLKEKTSGILTDPSFLDSNTNRYFPISIEKRLSEVRASADTSVALKQEDDFFNACTKQMLLQVSEESLGEHKLIKFASWSYCGRLFETKDFCHDTDLSDDQAFLFVQKLRTYLSGWGFDPSDSWSHNRKLNGQYNRFEVKKIQDFLKFNSESQFYFSPWNIVFDEERSPDGHGKTTRDYVIEWKQDFLIRMR